MSEQTGGTELVSGGNVAKPGERGGNSLMNRPIIGRLYMGFVLFGISRGIHQTFIDINKPHSGVGDIVLLSVVFALDCLLGVIALSMIISPRKSRVFILHFPGLMLSGIRHAAARIRKLFS